MSALNTLNPKAEHVKRGQALELNIAAAETVMDVLKSNFGPTGTQKMLIGGAGDIKITKDGQVLLTELPIAHPSIALISRTATAVDDVCGDGTTQTTLLIGELLRQSRRWLQEGVHPRVLVEGYNMAKDKCLEYLEKTRIEFTSDKELLQMAYTTVATKVKHQLAECLAQICVDSVKIAAKNQEEKKLIDLHMIEIMTMQHHADMDTKLIRGLVCDHGWRHEELKCSRFEKCHILTLNIGLEYEKAEQNTEYFYKSAEEKVKQAEKEREFINERVQKVIDLKRKVCKADECMVIFNMQGIDPESLQMLANDGICALRRVKKRNLERITLCCGGKSLNSLEFLEPSALGWADSVYEDQLGEEKFTFIEGVRDPKSCTILVRGPNKHTIIQIKDAIRDGLRAVKNLMSDKYFVVGAGSFECQLATMLKQYSSEVQGKNRLGVISYADAVLSIPKTIAKNSGYDAQDVVIKIQEAQKSNKNSGINVKTGETLDALKEGILDAYRVKFQSIHSATVIATQLLLVDEIMKAGRAISGGSEQEGNNENQPVH